VWGEVLFPLCCQLVRKYCCVCHVALLLLPGVRLVVEVKRGFSPELVLNQLYKNTRLQLRFASNMVSSAVHILH
jgi:hypothetical protein